MIVMHGTRCISIAAVLVMLLTACPAGLLHASPAQPKETKWAIVVGINDYLKEVTPLHCAVNDAEQFRKALIERGGFDDQHVYLLTSAMKGNRVPDKSNIVRWLSYIKQNASPGDTFVFFFSGHGMELEKESYFLTYESDPYSRETLEMSALRVSDLKRIIENLPVRRTLLFVDACRNDPRSGKGDVDNPLTDLQSKNLVIARHVAAGPAPKDCSLTIFSCNVGERSYEWSEKGMGFFTYYLVRGLGGEGAPVKGVTLGNLLRYLGREVPSAVKRERGAEMRQNPMIRGDQSPDTGDWVIASGSPSSPFRPVAEPTGKPARPAVTPTPVTASTPAAAGTLAPQASSVQPGSGTIEELSAMLARDRNNASLYVARGDLHNSRGNAVLAIDDYNRALALTPGDMGIYLKRAEGYTSLLQFDNALKDLQTAARSNPATARTVRYLCNRGIALAGKGDWAAAFESLEKALETDPNSALAYGCRGGAYFMKSDFTRAIADCTKAVELDPRCEWAYIFRARALLSRTPANEQNMEKYQRDCAQALENINRFLELKPDSAAGHLFRGYAHIGLTVFEKAIPDFNKALRLNPPEYLVKEALLLKGYCCELTNRFSEALETYKKYLELAPGNKDIQEKVKRMESL